MTDISQRNEYLYTPWEQATFKMLLDLVKRAPVCRELPLAGGGTIPAAEVISMTKGTILGQPHHSAYRYPDLEPLTLAPEATGAPAGWLRVQTFLYPSENETGEPATSNVTPPYCLYLNPAHILCWRTYRGLKDAMIIDWVGEDQIVHHYLYSDELKDLGRSNYETKQKESEDEAD